MNNQETDKNNTTAGSDNQPKNVGPNASEKTVNNKGLEEDTSTLYFGNTAMQSPQEFKADKEGDHQQEDDSITVSYADDESSDASAMAGDQAAANSTDNDDAIILNKGLEDQQIEKY